MNINKKLWEFRLENDMLNQTLQKIRDEKYSLEDYVNNQVKLIKLAILRILKIVSEKGDKLTKNFEQL